MIHGKMKRAYESAVLKQFLVRLRRDLTYRPPDENDAHDGLACQQGKPFAELELTRYLVDRTSLGSRQMTSVRLWYGTIWNRIDSERRRCSQLEHVFGSVEFSHPPRQKDAERLAAELSQIAQRAWLSRNQPRPLPGTAECEITEVHVEDRSSKLREYRCNSEARFNLDEMGSALTKQHVAALSLRRSSFSWPTWYGPDMAAGYVTTKPVFIKQILDEKIERVLNRQGTGLPIWLIIVCDLACDIRTHVLALEDNELTGLRSAVRSEAENRPLWPFDQLWLTSELRDRSVPLYGPSEW